jgi:serine/threonine protein kinase
MHRHAVIHRDVKVRCVPLMIVPFGYRPHPNGLLILSCGNIQPSNFLYSIERNEFLLVDFGLAELDESKVLQAENSSDASLQNYSMIIPSPLSMSFETLTIYCLFFLHSP